MLRRYQLSIRILPEVAWHGSKADRIQKLIVTDPEIRKRISELASSVDPRAIVERRTDAAGS
jgi:hypothetical protein